MKNLFFLISVAMLLLACSTGNEKTNQPVVVDYEALVNADFFSSNTFSQIEPVFLDTNGAVLGSPLYMKIKNDNYYICDMQQQFVYTFDPQGKLLNKLAKVGRAKGEYTILMDFDIYDNGDMVLLCDTGSKLIKYNPDGEVIEEMEAGFKANSVMIVDDGYLFSKDWYETPLNGNNTIIRTDSNLKISGGLLPKNDFIFANLIQRTFSQCGKENLPVYKNAYDNNIYRVINDTLQLAYTIDFGKKGFPDELFKMNDDIMGVYIIL